MSEQEQTSRENAMEHFKNFVVDIFKLDDVNFSKSIADIKSGVSFKGFNIWILICSILICSLGLNMNSNAVVIGAMLISPLMGPIVGLGLGIGIYDKKLIFRSLKNLGVATAISLVTAFVFFKITPTDAVDEILSRTQPTLLDLFVAFFGGIAGILAASRSISTNIIPGVAIATALMPPICTAGYGLASSNYDYFFGASYLFLMNCIMISLAATLVTFYLRYPKFSFVNESQKKNVRAGIALVVLCISIPSGFFYYNLLQESARKKNVTSFINKEILAIEGVYVLNWNLESNADNLNLNINVSGAHIDEDSIPILQKKMKNYLPACDLNVIQPQAIGFKEQRLASLKTDIISELYKNSSLTIKTKDDEIAILKNEIQKLVRSQEAFNQITKLAKSQFDIEKMAVDILVFTDGIEQDTVPTAIVEWKSKMKKSERTSQLNKLNALLSIQLNNSEKVKVVEVN